MEQTWRWWGPSDTIKLAYVRQAGATGIVTALHDIPTGEVWTCDHIEERRRFIEADDSLGLRWSVVESLPVHEDIKLGEGNLTRLFDNYRLSLRNLARSGVTTVCYNFMPVLDWCRTYHSFELPDGAIALRFNIVEFAAFDCFMVKRKNAELDYSPAVLKEAETWFENSTESSREKLLSNIMAGLPGAFDRYDIDELRGMLDRYQDIDKAALLENLRTFLCEIVPTAEEEGIRLAIHPDDPPWSILGLPRIVGSESDIKAVLECVDSPANGLTLCMGSLGAGPNNDISSIAKRFSHDIHFAHIRNVRKFTDGSFMEVEHLDGDNDVVGVMKVLLEVQARRKDKGMQHWRIPFRPDHGLELIDDIDRPHHPGYPLIGRLKGLAEVRGVMTTLANIYQYPI